MASSLFVELETPKACGGPEGGRRETPAQQNRADYLDTEPGAPCRAHHTSCLEAGLGKLGC